MRLRAGAPAGGGLGCADRVGPRVRGGSRDALAGGRRADTSCPPRRDNRASRRERCRYSDRVLRPSRRALGEALQRRRRSWSRSHRRRCHGPARRVRRRTGAPECRLPRARVGHTLRAHQPSALGQGRVISLLNHKGRMTMTPQPRTDKKTLVWLITGSSRGLGRALAEAVLAAGHKLVATARDPKQLSPLVERYGDQVRAVALDVTDERAAAGAIQAAVDSFGRLDVLVNNAGYGDVASIEDTSMNAFRAQIETNPFGLSNLTK